MTYLTLRPKRNGLTREIDRVFNDFFNFPAMRSESDYDFMPRVDIVEGKDDIKLTFELPGMKKEDIERGMVVCKPKSVTPHTKFDCEVYVLTKEEGGRHTPFFTGYRPQFYFRTTDVTGTAELPTGVEMVMPGDNVKMDVELITPIAMEEGLRFAVREGGRTVGAGTVTEIKE